MSKEEAEAMVFDLIEAVKDYERADRYSSRYYRQEYETQRDRLIAALTRSPQDTE